MRYDCLYSVCENARKRRACGFHVFGEAFYFGYCVMRALKKANHGVRGERLVSEFLSQGVRTYPACRAAARVRAQTVAYGEAVTAFAFKSGYAVLIVRASARFAYE